MIKAHLVVEERKEGLVLDFQPSDLKDATEMEKKVAGMLGTAISGVFNEVQDAVRAIGGKGYSFSGLNLTPEQKEQIIKKNAPGWKEP